jgi:hypothetical protein
MLFHQGNPLGRNPLFFHEVLRMRIRTIFPAMLLVVGLIGLAVWPVPAAEPADTAKIAKLVEQLGSDTFSDRQKASEALDNIGEPALNALLKAAESTDAEVRKRAQELVERIEKRTENAGALAPKMVHLIYKDAPLADAVADFAKKSGYAIELHDPDDKLKGKTITLDTGKVTFWAALERFCTKAGVIDGKTGPLAPPIGVGAFAGGAAVVPPALLPPRVAAPARVAPAVPPKPPAKEEKKEEDKKEKKRDGKKEDTKKAKEGKDEAKKEEAKPVVKVGGIGVVLMPRVAGGGPAVVVPLNPVVGAPGGVGFRGVPPPYGPIMLSPGKADSRAVDTTSAVRVRAGEKKHYRLSDEEIALVLIVSPESRLNWQSMLSVVIDKAIDDNDQKLTQTTRQAAGGVGVPGAGGIGGVIIPGAAWGNVRLTGHGHNYNVTARLKKGEKGSNSLKELTGTIAGQIRGEAESLLVIDDIMKSAGKSVTRKPSGEMKVLAVEKKEDGAVQIHFELEFPANSVAESTIPVAGAPAKPLPAPPGIPPPAAGAGIAIAPPPVMPPQHFAFNGLTLRDAKGNILPATIEFHWKRPGGFVLGNRRMEYIATYKPADKDAPQPAKLVFTGRRDVSVSIPFTLKNVELK